MRVRQRQIVYGSAFGATTFLVGWAITVFLTPPDVLAELPRWKSSLWIYLSAHFVSISGLQLVGIGAAFVEVDLLSHFPQLQILRVMPIFLTTIGGLLMIEVVNYTTRFHHLIQNAGSLLIGYLSVGFLAFIVSGAQPGVAMLIVSGAILAAGAYIGGTVTQRLTGAVPVFAVISVGGVVLIGLLILLGGTAIVTAIGPMIAVSTLGVTIAAVLAYVSRNVPT